MKQRYLALDAMRGLTLALMIVVNTPGSWAHIYAPLRHAQWHGWTPTDLVFPFFLFIVGAALFFSRAAQVQVPLTHQLLRIAKRAGLLVLIGVLLEYYPFQQPLENLRLPGVLQRIGLAYGLAACAQLAWQPMTARAQMFANTTLIAVIVVGYSVLLRTAAEPFSLEGNLVRTLDVALLGAPHLWAGAGVAFDPEGLLSTLPAVATVLIGYEAARWLRSGQRFWVLMAGLTGVGLVLTGSAYLWPDPINKSLWTSSYVLLTGGLGLVCLASLLLLERWWVGARLQKPLVVLGENPLFIYILAWVWVRSYGLIATEEGTLYQTVYQWFSGFASLEAASLMFALAHLLPLWGLAWWLHKRKIFIKI
ncbi:heparan-alpha-glucosaminide N-acetyltransferase domain-containing protein [Simiduia sp. 21SJ11W-1]|uniref:acyltransferase family protein n=1 Tax=Simiduia sp. 21SJ11W-1 TaxID=2909669 RepID=UPI0020A07F26|nr:heparan-alpha-glucosaminide N-acetyltransferase domain-containing protein [Simiduia sp. 21SJ11W-1]UTA46606.1 heparan-alpha-glucosaminide N-acetyltransferase domain-containing protein [Simiduia sp. 21SJ11W-1]